MRALVQELQKSEMDCVQVKRAFSLKAAPEMMIVFISTVQECYEFFQSP